MERLGDGCVAASVARAAGAVGSASGARSRGGCRRAAAGAGGRVAGAGAPLGAGDAGRRGAAGRVARSAKCVAVGRRPRQRVARRRGAGDGRRAGGALWAVVAVACPGAADRGDGRRSGDPPARRHAGPRPAGRHPVGGRRGRRTAVRPRRRARVVDPARRRRAADPHPVPRLAHRPGGRPHRAGPGGRLRAGRPAAGRDGGHEHVRRRRRAGGHGAGRERGPRRRGDPGGGRVVQHRGQWPARRGARDRGPHGAPRRPAAERGRRGGPFGRPQGDAPGRPASRRRLGRRPLLDAQPADGTGRRPVPHAGRVRRDDAGAERQALLAGRGPLAGLADRPAATGGRGDRGLREGLRDGAGCGTPGLPGRRRARRRPTGPKGSTCEGSRRRPS